MRSFLSPNSSCKVRRMVSHSLPTYEAMSYTPSHQYTFTTTLTLPTRSVVRIVEGRPKRSLLFTDSQPSWNSWCHWNSSSTHSRFIKHFFQRIIHFHGRFFQFLQKFNKVTLLHNFISGHFSLNALQTFTPNSNNKPNNNRRQMWFELSYQEGFTLHCLTIH